MMSCLSSHWSDILRTQYNDVLPEFPLVRHSQAEQSSKKACFRKAESFFETLLCRQWYQQYNAQTGKALNHTHTQKKHSSLLHEAYRSFSTPTRRRPQAGEGLSLQHALEGMPSTAREKHNLINVMESNKLRQQQHRSKLTSKLTLELSTIVSPGRCNWLKSSHAAKMAQPKLWPWLPL